MLHIIAGSDGVPIYFKTNPLEDEDTSCIPLGIVTLNMMICFLFDLYERDDLFRRHINNLGTNKTRPFPISSKSLPLSNREIPLSTAAKLYPGWALYYALLYKRSDLLERIMENISFGGKEHVTNGSNVR